MLIDPFGVTRAYWEPFGDCHLPDMRSARYNPLEFIRNDESLAVHDFRPEPDGARPGRSIFERGTRTRYEHRISPHAAKLPRSTRSLAGAGTQADGFVACRANTNLVIRT